MVVRLDLEDDMMRIVEADHAGVVAEHADAPVLWAEAAADLAGGGEDCLLEHVLEVPLAALVAIADAAGQRLVAAMLAPRLRDGFELDVRRARASGRENAAWMVLHFLDRLK